MVQPLLITALLGVAVGIILGWWLRAAYLRWISFTRVYRRWHPPSVHPPSVPTWRADARAAERRRAIQALLEEDRSGLGPSLEFLETPPGFKSFSPNFFENPLERAAQMARLKWQLRSDELLLAERVVDAVIAISRVIGPRGLASVHLVSDRLEAQEGKFLWSVLIETNFAEELKEEFSGMADWLGIGVYFGRAREVRVLGQCIEPRGMRGVVGGFLHLQWNDTYAMTAAHVLSPFCQSVVIRADPRSPNTPDAALIRAGSPCFGNVTSGSYCDPATEDLIQMWTTNRTTVAMCKPGSNPRLGFISSRLVAFPLNGVYYRFPHCSVIPSLPRILLYVPFGRRAFSQPGDSGSWVFEVKTGKWLGMLVGGDSDFLVSYIAEAQPLLEYFESSLRGTKGEHYVATARALTAHVSR